MKQQTKDGLVKGDGQSLARLDSWKEIASHFSRDVRTVRRWEQERGLPVYRVPGKERGGVFAYVGELEAWLRETGRSEEPEETAGEDAALELYEAEAITEPADVSPVEDEVVSMHGEAVDLPDLSLHRRTWAAGLAVVVALALIALTVVWRIAARVTAERAPDATTRELYLRGRYLWNQRTESSLTEAADLFTQAIVRSPRYAPAYAGLADSYLLLRQYGHMPDGEAYPRAYFASRQAIELDGGSAEAHRTYGFVLNYWMWNLPAAEAEFRRAIELDPRDAQSHHWYATTLVSAGRYTEALKEIDAARQIEPDSVAVLVNRGFILSFIDRERALDELQEIERTNPESAYVHRYLAEIRLLLGQDEEFLQEMQEYELRLSHRPEAGVLDKARAELESHGAEAMLRTLAEGYGKLADVPGSPDAMTAAGYYARLKDAQRTLNYLALSCSRRESNFTMLPNDSEFHFLQGEPRFTDLLARSRRPFTGPQLAGTTGSKALTR